MLMDEKGREFHLDSHWYEIFGIKVYKLKFILSLCLLFFNSSCIDVLVDPGQTLRVTPGPTRTILQNNLQLSLSWSKALTNGRPPVKAPLVCSNNRGAILSVSPDEKTWRGTALFDDQGNVIWNNPEETAVAVALDDQAVYTFTPPKLNAYNINTGELLWETNEGLGFRLSAYLSIEDDKLLFMSDKRINFYQLSDGALLSEEKITSEDLLLRHGFVDYHTNSYLYATAKGNSEEILWQTDTQASKAFLPQIYKDSLIVQSGLLGSKVCRVNALNGDEIWCEDMSLLSNVVIHNDLGYAVNRKDEIIGFRIEDGKQVGKIVLSPEGTHDIKVNYHMYSCDDNLLVYLTSPEELFWFNFIEEIN